MKIAPLPIRTIACCCMILATTNALISRASAEDMAPFKRAFITGNNTQLRGSLDNSHVQFTSKKRGHVAFIGGSITEMNGYRPRVCSMLSEIFPDTKFKFTAAGISSTCSTTGAFRLQRDVLSHGDVDLFFIEFAVNDDQDAGHARRECIRGLEGIIRQTRTHNPHADIVVTCFVNPSMLKQIQDGKTPLTVEAHEAVTKHYDVSSIYLAKEVADQISGDKLTWEKFGGTHPKPFGNDICATMIESLLKEAWKSPATTKQVHLLPKLLDEGSYVRGRFIPINDVTLGEGWKTHTPEWKALAGSCRSRFVDAELLSAESGAGETTLKFTGTAIGAYLLAGPDAGTLEISIDGKRLASPVSTYHRYSRGLHYPRTVMLATDLKSGEHTLRIRPSDEHDPQSKGTAIRILAFAAN